MSSWMTCVLILIVGSIGSQCLRRQVSSRDWPEDEPEYEIIDPNKPEVSFRSSTTSRPPAPVGPTSAPVWSCGFDGHDCGITNDQIVGSYFVLKTNQMRPLLGKRHYLLLNITDIKPLSSGARLITPYFETRHSPQGCLTIDYVIRGKGVKDMIVWQQEKENRCLWSQGSDHSSGVETPPQEWRKLSLSIDLTYGSPRFFIETHFDNRPPNEGLVAISEIQFLYTQCRHNFVNNCGQHRTSTEDPDLSTDDYVNDLP